MNKRRLWKQKVPAGIEDVEEFGLYKRRVSGRDGGGCFFVFVVGLLCVFVPFFFPPFSFSSGVTSVLGTVSLLVSS